MKKTHNNTYQSKDACIVDYDIYPSIDLTDKTKQNAKYKLEDLAFAEQDFQPPWLRGPKPNLDEKFFTVLGSAHSFGRYCKNPWPNILADKLNMGCLNLSLGGAEASIYLKPRQSFMFDYINKSDFVILQIMSGRSSGNSVIDSTGHYCIDKSTGEKMLTEDFYRELIGAKKQDVLKRLLSETQQTYVNSYIELIEKIKVPIILFWFSNRTTELEPKFDYLKDFYGPFPQFVNTEMVEKIKSYCSQYTECVSIKGRPHVLTNRFTGDFMWNDNRYGPLYEKWNGMQIDEYYPTPEMHVEAMGKLLPVCNQMITKV